MRIGSFEEDPVFLDRNSVDRDSVYLLYRRPAGLDLGFSFSKILDPILSIQELRLDRTDAERDAPGKEVAYIADARSRFGGHT